MQTDMKVGGMPVPGSNTPQPRAVRPVLFAQCLLYRRMNEYACDPIIVSGKMQQLCLGGRPVPTIDEEVFPVDHCHCRDVILPRTLVARQRRYVETQPHIGIETRLVTAVSMVERSTARHRDVGDEHGSKIGIVHPEPEIGKIVDEHGMSVVPVSGESHDLVARSLGGQFGGAEKTAVGVGADGLRVMLAGRGEDRPRGRGYGCRGSER